jgi:predicted nucleic acid-binding protein
MSVLIDSSAWIEYFRGNQDFKFIQNLLLTNSVVTNELILAELLPSMIHRKERDLADLMKSIPLSPLNIIWEEIRNVQLLNLQHGYTHIGIPDIMIVQNCVQNGLMLLHSDKHFDKMSEYINFQIYKKP